MVSKRIAIIDADNFAVLLVVEFDLIDHLFLIFVSRNEQSDINLDGCGHAKPFKLSVLEHTEAFRLGGRTHAADFTKKQGALPRQFKAFFVPFFRPDKSPFSWPDSSFVLYCSFYHQRQLSENLG